MKLILPGSGGGPFPPLATLVEAFDGSARMDGFTCLALGDSVSMRVANEDEDRRPLPRMLEDKLQHGIGKARIVNVSFSAFNMRVYEALIAVLETCERKPDVLLVPVNLRSFSPQWFSNPFWQLEEHVQLIRDRARRPDAAIGPVSPVYERPEAFVEFDEIRVECGVHEFAKIGEFRREIDSVPSNEAEVAARLNTLLAFHSGCDVRAEHPLLAALRRLLQAARRMSLQTLVYATPINLALIRELGRDDIAAVAGKNVKLVGRICNEQDTPLVDLTDALNADDFFHHGSPTEHLNYSGREKLARELCGHLHALFMKQRGRPATAQTVIGKSAK